MGGSRRTNSKLHEMTRNNIARFFDYRLEDEIRNLTSGKNICLIGLKIKTSWVFELRISTVTTTHRIYSTRLNWTLQYAEDIEFIASTGWVSRFNVREAMNSISSAIAVSNLSWLNIFNVFGNV